MKNVNGSDVKQGGLGDCWLMASMSGLANVEGAIQRTCVEYNTRIGIYGFAFYKGMKHYCNFTLSDGHALTRLDRWRVDLLHNRR